MMVEVEEVRPVEPAVHIQRALTGEILCGATRYEIDARGDRIVYSWERCACRGCAEVVVRELCERWRISCVPLDELAGDELEAMGEMVGERR